MNLLSLRLFLLFLLIPAVLHSEISMFACMNEVSSEKRFFKLEKSSVNTVVYTLFQEKFYPLCDSLEEFSDTGGVICVYGKDSKRQYYVATFFPEGSKKIIDFLIDKNDIVSDRAKWKQKAVSYCNEITTLNF